MRYELKFEVDENFIQLEYRKVIMSYLKWALTNYEEGKFFSILYDNKKSKDMSFSAYFDKAQFTNNRIKLDKKDFKVTISTSDKKIALTLFNAILSNKNKKFKLSEQNNMKLNSIKIKPEKEITENSVLFKTLSPICIREHVREGNKDYYYSIESDCFIEKLKDCIEYQMKDKYEVNTENIQIVPINCKKTVVKHNGQFIESTIGSFAIYADKIILEELYMNGCGSRKSSGFGHLEVVN